MHGEMTRVKGSGYMICLKVPFWHSSWRSKRNWKML